MESLARDDKLAAMRVLLLNLNPETNELVSSALAGQGYDVTTESGLTVDEVLALLPEVLVTEASPTDLSCCGMISQLKSRSDTRASVRIAAGSDGSSVMANCRPLSCATWRNARSRSSRSSSSRAGAKLSRSEERRVGKECRSRWSPYH